VKLKELIAEIKYEILFGNLDIEIQGISCDSRKCGENYIFVAIRGFESDGHKFIENAINNGAVCIIYEAGVGIDASRFSDITFMKVLNSRKVYSYLCNKFYNFPSEKINLIGITGTNGKTTISYILEKIVPFTGVIGTINYRFNNYMLHAENTTPMSCDINKFIKNSMEQGCKNVALEVSSHGADLSRIDYLAFDLGIFTNLSPEHLDYHKTIDNYFNAKKRFFTEILLKSSKKIKYAIINIDDKYGKKLIKEIHPDISIFTYSLNNRAADIFTENYDLSLNKTKIKINLKSEIIDIETNLIGEHNIYNILASILAAYILKLDIKTIEKSFTQKIVIPGRLEKPIPDTNIFVDYAHTPDALEKVLINLNKLKNKKGKIITVFGCGGDRDKSKRPVMGYSAAKFSDYLVVTSDNPRTEDPLLIIDNILEGVNKAIDEKIIDNKNYRVIPNRKDAIKMCLKLMKKEDIVLIAGKGHENYQIVGKEKKYFSDADVVKEFFK